MANYGNMLFWLDSYQSLLKVTRVRQRHVYDVILIAKLSYLEQLSMERWRRRRARRGRHAAGARAAQGEVRRVALHAAALLLTAGRRALG